MKYFKIRPYILMIGVLFMLPACSIFETKKVIDPNLPSQESVLTNASAVQLNELGVGVQSAMRDGLLNFRQVAGSIGRELYVLSSVELTWTTELLGTTNGGLSLTTGFNGSYDNFSQTRRRAELFQRSAGNSSALTEPQKNSIRGFCNTVEAYVMLNNLNMQYQNGIRISFSDLNAPGDLLKPGPFVSYDAALTEIKRLLDLSQTQLQAAVDAGVKNGAPAGSTTTTDVFAFSMTSSWAGFAVPSSFIKFNRAMAAEVMMYQKDWNGMLTALGASYMDLTGPLAAGPVFTYSTAPGDAINPVYHVKNDNAAPIVPQALFVSDAEQGDTRVPAKTALRETGTPPVPNPRTINGLTGNYDVYMYSSNSSSIPIIKNEELILMYAEAKIQQGSLDEGITALDAVRVGSGLHKLADADAAHKAIVNEPDPTAKKAKLITEMLTQRRYSLFYEGHRWFDMRRYDLLNTLPNDLPTAKVYVQMIRPFAEVQWDAKNPQ